MNTAQPACETRYTYQERVVTVTAGDAAHARHREQRRRHRARRQIDDALAVGPRAGDPLGRALADEQTVAGTSDVLLARWRVPDGLEKG